MMDEYQKVLINEPKLLMPKVEKVRRSMKDDLQNSVKKLKIDCEEGLDLDESKADDQKQSQPKQSKPKKSLKNKKK